eukprot:Skav223487  [mRNA]  locus=scaffold643:91348:99007:+ [translate_table: standard]
MYVPEEPWLNREDLVVEAGAYRASPREASFVPVPECNEFGPPGQRVTKCEWTPLTAHVVKDAGTIGTVLSDHSKMEKIVDDQGHNAGYATFVETMAKEAMDLKGLQLFLGHEASG